MVSLPCLQVFSYVLPSAWSTLSFASSGSYSRPPGLSSYIPSSRKLPNPQAGSVPLPPEPPSQLCRLRTGLSLSLGCIIIEAWSEAVLVTAVYVPSIVLGTQ